VYRLDPKEIRSVLDDEGFLPLDKDPKLSIALNNPDKFPVDINTAGEEELLAVPGIGPQSVKKILQARQKDVLFKDFPDLLEAGVGKSAFPFVSVGGKTQSRLSQFA
jgi:predicted DNA-binding helix-hairpin-helix protein